MAKPSPQGMTKIPSNGTSLYWQRAKEQFRFDLSLLKSSLDWTVWAYLFIPLFMVGVYHYSQMITGKAWWAEGISGTMIAVALSLFVLLGRIRIFLHPADQLFLWQEQSWINSLKRWGLIHFYLKSFGSTSLLGLLLFPFLHIYLQFSLVNIVQLFILLWLAKGLFALLKRMADLSFPPVTAYLFKGVLWGLNLMLFVVVIPHPHSGRMVGLTALLGLFSLLCIRLYFKKPLPFDRASKLEAKEKLKYARFLLAQTVFLGSPSYVAGQKARLRAKPLLFRRSQPLFSQPDEVKGMVELILKSFLRSLTWVSAYFQVASLATFGLLMLPFGLKLVLWAIILIALSSILKSFWREIMEHPFLTLLSFSQEVKQKAGRQALVYLMTPLGGWLSGLCGYLTFSYWGILPFLCFGIALIYGAAHWQTSTEL